MTAEDRAFEELECKINSSKNGDIMEVSDVEMRKYINVTKDAVESAHERDKPKQYAKGIDTIERAKSRLSAEALLAVCVFQVDKYIWRDNGADLEDFKKARDYIDLAIETMEG